MSENNFFFFDTNDGCLGTFVLLMFGMLFLGFAAVFLAIFVVFLLVYGLVSWAANRLEGPDPEPSPSFWDRLGKWAERNESQGW